MEAAAAEGGLSSGRFYIKAASSVGTRGGYGGGGGNGGGTKCGRWNPTSEQVKVLTDLFRSGLRTPSTDQIQRISSQLSYYGKIESKNVFYWFQNHKARERQKRRKVVVVDNDSSTTVRDDWSNIRKDNHKDINPIQPPPPPPKQYFGTRTTLNNQVVEPERVMETLQLFPLNPFDDLETEKIRFHANDCRDFSHAFGSDYMDHPPLDLRLSFA